VEGQGQLLDVVLIGVRKLTTWLVILFAVQNILLFWFLF
jgi:hypothetical protein